MASNNDCEKWHQVTHNEKFGRSAIVFSTVSFGERRCSRGCFDLFGHTSSLPFIRISSCLIYIHSQGILAFVIEMAAETADKQAATAQAVTSAATIILRKPVRSTYTPSGDYWDSLPAALLGYGHVAGEVLLPLFPHYTKYLSAVTMVYVGMSSVDRGNRAAKVCLTQRYELLLPFHLKGRLR